MTEQDLQRLEDEMSSVTADDVAAERAWLQQQMETLKVQEQQTRAAFRMSKFLRQDEHLVKVHNDWRKVQSALDYCRSRLAELGGK